MASSVLYGLLAFAVLLAVWVVLPHRLVHRRPPAAGGRPERTVPSVRRPLRALTRPTWRRHLVGMRITRQARTEGIGAHAYQLVIDITGLNGGSESRVPIHKELTRTADVLLKERYWATIAGVRVEAGNLPALEAMAREVVGWLLDGQRLPHYWFRVPQQSPVPVFLRGGRYLARVPGGPQFAAPSLGAVRSYLAAYVGGAPEVAALSFADMRYHGAYAVLEAPGVWIPVFADRGALRVPDSETGGVPVASGDLLSVRRAAADALFRNGDRPPALDVITYLDADARATLLAASRPAEHVLQMPDAGGRRRTAVEIRRVGEELACEPEPALRTIFLGRDLWSLVDVVGMELERRGRVRRDEVGVQRVADAMGTVR